MSACGQQLKQWSSEIWYRSSEIGYFMTDTNLALTVPMQKGGVLYKSAVIFCVVTFSLFVSQKRHHHRLTQHPSLIFPLPALSCGSQLALPWQRTAAVLDLVSCIFSVLNSSLSPLCPFAFPKHPPQWVKGKGSSSPITDLLQGSVGVHHTKPTSPSLIPSSLSSCSVTPPGSLHHKMGDWESLQKTQAAKIAGIPPRIYRTECDIRMDFDTNEYPNIFVSKEWYKRISE